MLSLAEEILLLSLLEKKESLRLSSSLSLPFVLSGAVILDLILSGMLKMEDERLVSTGIPIQPGNETRKDLLEIIEHSEKPRKLNHWVYILGAKGKRISKPLILALIKKGILLQEKKAFQWVRFEHDGVQRKEPIKYLLKRQLRDALFCEEALSEHLTACLTLLDACDLLEHIFTKDEIVAARKKLRSIKAEATYTQGFLELLDQTLESIAYAVASAEKA